jgi:putative alpha-1,2-mannosidase
VTLRLPGGRVRISARGAAPTAPFVQGLRLDGRRWSRPWLRLADVAHGGRLQFALGPRPDPHWGAAPSLAPPSFGPDDASACDPDPADLTAAGSER